MKKSWTKAEAACKLRRLSLDSRRKKTDRRFFETVMNILLDDIKKEER